MGIDSAANVVVATPAELVSLAERVTARALGIIDEIRTGDGAGLVMLDRYDEATAALSDLAHAMNVIQQVHPEADSRGTARELEQRLRETMANVDLDNEIFRVLADLDCSEGDAEARHYLGRVLRDLRRAGAERDAATRERIRELRRRLTRLTQDFEQVIRSDTRYATFPSESLAGLPADYLSARSTDPSDPSGPVRISTEYPDLHPVLAFCRTEAVRETMWRLSQQRGYPANERNLRDLLACRHELATLLGYASWAEYAAEDKMIGSGTAIKAFIDRIAGAARARARIEYDRLLACKRRDDPGATRVEVWDLAYLRDRLAAETYGIDNQQLRQYFEYDRVKNGAIRLLGRLFGVSFQPVATVPTWHPEVECFEVSEGPRVLGRIFLDAHPRPDKFQHLGVYFLRVGKAGARLPECALLCNLPRPGDGPALLLPSDVRSLLHELGHLVHYILSGHGQWAGNGLPNLEWDFIETPSQLLEEWANDPATLADLAAHHETGAALPAAAVAYLGAVQQLDKGLETLRSMYLAALSYQLHSQNPAGLDPASVERHAFETYLPYRWVEGVQPHLRFWHLSGYSAVYYTYTWSLVIAKDLFGVLAGSGHSDPASLRRYRDKILARGSAAPAAELVEDFLGRPVSFDAYLEWINAQEAPARPAIAPGSA